MTTTQDRLNRAEQLAKEGELEGAASELRSLLQQEPQHLFALVQLSKILLMSEEVDEAEHWVNKALKLDPEHPEACTAMGIARLAREDYNQAIVWFEKALKKDPSLIYAHMNLGKSYKQLERWQEAEKSLREAHRLSKEAALQQAKEAAKPGETIKEEVGHFQALYDLAEVLANTNRVEESIYTLLECLQINPLFVPAYVALGEMYKMAEEYQLAIEIYLEGLNHNPYIDAFHEELVELYQLTGNLQAAKAHQMELATERQGYGDFLDLGMLATLDGRADQAEAAWRKATETEPNFWQAHYNLAELYKNARKLCMVGIDSMIVHYIIILIQTLINR